MMNFGKAPVARSASRLARAVSKAEPTLQRGVSARTATVLMSTRSGLLGISQVAPKFPMVHHQQLRKMSGEVMTPDMKAVEAATLNWRDTVTSNTEDAPKKTAALYAPDALFWGTVSEEVRLNPQHVYDYFDFFARLPKLSMVAFDPAAVRVHGDFAVHAGAYTFSWLVDGKPKETRARFTFAYRREKDGWVIVEHHSSGMPQAPAALKPAH